MSSRRTAGLLPFALLPAVALAGAQTQPTPLRGYTIMAGGLGRAPGGKTDMWSNTEAAHLDFIDRARINLVAIELPYGLSERYPKSPAVARLIVELRQRKVAVWLLYPHVLAQTFDLPRQVGSDGKVIDWNCCCNAGKVQDWLCDNGVRLCEAYRPDALILFGTFHVGGDCRCEGCRQAKVKSAQSQERFFLRLGAEVSKVSKGTKIGTCDFWVPPTRATLQAVDIVCPVVPIFRPGYADAAQVQRKLGTLGSQGKDEQVVPYVKVFLASQTSSTTDDVLGALRECCARADGFLLWGYNPRHSYQGQDYDHAAILQALAAMADKPRR